MIKMFLTLLVAGFTMSAMAAPQYGMNIEQENAYVTAGLNTSIGWTITAKQDVMLSFTNDLDTLAGVNNHMKNVISNLNNGSFSALNTALGYMIYDTATKTVTSVSDLTFADNVASVTLNAGETLGFWMTVDGINYSSIRGVDGYTYNMSTFGGGDNGNGKVYNYANGWYRDANNSNYGYEQSLLISATEAPPSGQPLPGVLAVLVIGGSALGSRLMRRKSQK